MRRAIGARVSVSIMSVVAMALLTVGTSSASAAGPVTKSFSFIGTANSKTQTVFNLDDLLINARCNAAGEPVIFAFSASNNADLFGRAYDGFGRLHIIKDSSFVKGTGGDRLSTTSGDFDGTGTVLFETYAGKVVTLDYAFDNSTTLAKRNVCTVYGSAIAT